MFTTFNKSLVVLLVLAFISGCSVIKMEQDWGQDLPSSELFSAYYQLDEANQSLQSEANYLAWVRRFFYGTPLQPKGWLKVTEELLVNVSDDERPLLVNTMTLLGTKIAKEWAKDNKIRKIDTKNMLVWGTALKESVANDDIVGLLERVSSDVDALLRGDLDAKQINSDRYYAMEFDEFF